MDSAGDMPRARAARMLEQMCALGEPAIHRLHVGPAVHGGLMEEFQPAVGDVECNLVEVMPNGQVSTTLGSATLACLTANASDAVKLESWVAPSGQALSGPVIVFYRHVNIWAPWAARDPPERFDGVVRDFYAHTPALPGGARVIHVLCYESGNWLNTDYAPRVEAARAAPNATLPPTAVHFYPILPEPGIPTLRAYVAGEDCPGDSWESAVSVARDMLAEFVDELWAGEPEESRARACRRAPAVIHDLCLGVSRLEFDRWKDRARAWAATRAQAIDEAQRIAALRATAAGGADALAPAVARPPLQWEDVLSGSGAHALPGMEWRLMPKRAEQMNGPWCHGAKFVERTFGQIDAADKVSRRQRGAVCTSAGSEHKRPRPAEPEGPAE